MAVRIFKLKNKRPAETNGIISWVRDDKTGEKVAIRVHKNWGYCSGISTWWLIRSLVKNKPIENPFSKRDDEKALARHKEKPDVEPKMWAKSAGVYTMKQVGWRVAFTALITGPPPNRRYSRVKGRWKVLDYLYETSHRTVGELAEPTSGKVFAYITLKNNLRNHAVAACITPEFVYLLEPNYGLIRWTHAQMSADLRSMEEDKTRGPRFTPKKKYWCGVWGGVWAGAIDEMKVYYYL